MSLGEHSHFALYARAARSLDTCSLLPFTEASGNRNSVRNFRTDLGVRRVLGMGTGIWYNESDLYYCRLSNVLWARKSCGTPSIWGDSKLERLLIRVCVGCKKGGELNNNWLPLVKLIDNWMLRFRGCWITVVARECILNVWCCLNVVRSTVSSTLAFPWYFKFLINLNASRNFSILWMVRCID